MEVIAEVIIPVIPATIRVVISTVPKPMLVPATTAARLLRVTVPDVLVARPSRVTLPMSPLVAEVPVAIMVLIPRAARAEAFVDVHPAETLNLRAQ